MSSLSPFKFGAFLLFVGILSPTIFCFQDELSQDDKAFHHYLIASGVFYSIATFLWFLNICWANEIPLGFSLCLTTELNDTATKFHRKVEVLLYLTMFIWN